MTLLGVGRRGVALVVHAEHLQGQMHAAGVGSIGGGEGIEKIVHRRLAGERRRLGHNVAKPPGQFSKGRGGVWRYTNGKAVGICAHVSIINLLGV